MNTRKTGRKKSRAELYQQTQQKRSPSKRDSSPDPEFHMTQVQKIISWTCVGVGIIASWILQAILGMKGIITTSVVSGIGGGIGGLIGIGIVLLMMTPDQKRKHIKRKKT